MDKASNFFETMNLSKRILSETLLQSVEEDGGDGPSLSCFPAGTQVLLPDGQCRSIELINVGDVIMSFDGSNSIPVTVEEIEKPVRDHLYVLTFDNGSTLKLTQEHPLFTKDGLKSISPECTTKENFKLKVEKLEIGDRVFSEGGSYKILIEMSYVKGTVQTYNLKKLSDLNCFYVNGLLAHNKATT